MYRRAAVLAAAIALLAVTPAYAAPHWSRAQRLSDLADGFDLAAETNGHAAAAWVAPERGGGASIALAARPPGGRFGPPQRLTDPLRTFDRPDVAVGAGGNAIVVWSDGYPAYPLEAEPGQRARVWWAECTPTCNAPAVLPGGDDTTDRTDARVALFADGAAVAVWRETRSGTGDDGALVAAVKPTGKPFEPPRVIAASHGATPALAAGGETGVVAWTAQDRYPPRIVASLLHERGAFSPPATVSDDTYPDSSPPCATVDSGGNASLAWSRYVDGAHRVELASSRSGSPFAKPTRVGISNPLFTGPGLTSGAANDLVVAWIRSASRRDQIEVATRRGGGPLHHTTVFVNRTRTGNLEDPAAVWSAGGDLVSAWAGQALSQWHVDSRIRLHGRRALPVGRLQPAVPVSGQSDYSQPQLRLAAAGREVVAAWRSDQTLVTAFH